jgi:hypothetical protein
MFKIVAINPFREDLERLKFEGPLAPTTRCLDAGLSVAAEKPLVLEGVDTFPEKPEPEDASARLEVDKLYDIPKIAERKLVIVEIEGQEPFEVAIVDQENGITDPAQINRILKACTVKGIGDIHGAPELLEILEKAGAITITGDKEAWFAAIDRHQEVLRAPDADLDAVFASFGELSITQDLEAQKFKITFGTKDAPQAIEISFTETSTLFIFNGDYTDRGLFSQFILAFIFMFSTRENSILLLGNHDSKLAEGEPDYATEGFSPETSRLWVSEEEHPYYRDQVTQALAVEAFKICSLLCIGDSEELGYLLSHAGFTSSIMDRLTDVIHASEGIEEVTPIAFNHFVRKTFQDNWANILEMRKLEQEIADLNQQSQAFLTELKETKSVPEQTALIAKIFELCQTLTIKNIQYNERKRTSEQFFSSVFFNVGKEREGDDKEGGPLWQDILKLIAEAKKTVPKEPKMQKARQIVGHSDTFRFFERENIGPAALANGSITDIDGGMCYGGKSFIAIHPDGRIFGFVKNKETNQWVCSLLVEVY